MSPTHFWLQIAYLGHEGVVSSGFGDSFEARCLLSDGLGVSSYISNIWIYSRGGGTERNKA